MRKLDDKELRRTIRIIEKHTTMTSAAQEVGISIQNLYKRLENNNLKVERDINLKVVSVKGESMKNEKGFIGDMVIGLVLLVIVGLFLAMFFVRFKASNEVVSGIAYNTTNDHLISGNTTFSVRAGENTYVSQENKSSYCLPPHSPYKELVNKAAQDKRIKIVVTAKKYFAIQAPWTCKNNVTVTEVK